MARAGRTGSRLDALTVAACASMSLLATFLPATLRNDVAGVLRRTLVAPLLGLQQQAERARTAVREREGTTIRLDSLVLRAAQVSALAQENDRLRQLLGLGRQLQYGFVATEALRGDPRADRDGIVLPVGSRAGVEKDALVVAPEGLVGKVTTVDPGMSLAILWTHPDFRVSAMAADGSAFGIVQPHGGEEPERYLLEMRGVAFRDVLRPGTAITSSGLGGVFPRGIPIGTVLGEVRTIEGWARTYLLLPAVKPQDVTSVMVLLAPRTRGEIASVWASAATADSAVRRIAAAGDSLTRLDAEARVARQRSLDSAAALLNGVNVAPSMTASDSLRPRVLLSPLRRDTVKRQ